MAWTYQVDYRLGPRGGRVTRTYSGFRAFLAVAVDLTLGLVFGTIGLILGAIGWAGWLVWHFFRLSILAVRDILLTLGRFVRAVILLPERLVGTTNPRRLPAKPARFAIDDL